MTTANHPLPSHWNWDDPQMLHTDFLETRFLHMADTRQIPWQSTVLRRAVCSEGFRDGADCTAIDIICSFDLHQDSEVFSPKQHCCHPGSGIPKPHIFHFAFSAVVEEMVMFAALKIIIAIKKQLLSSEHLLLSKLKGAHGGKVRKAGCREWGWEASKSFWRPCDAAPHSQSCKKD